MLVSRPGQAYTALSLWAVVILLLKFASADLTTTISTASDFGTWEGWGVSLAWWAAKFGQRTDLADLFFTTNSVTFNGVATPGLGLNIVRYNAGATSWNTAPDGSTLVESPDIITSRLIEGYWLDWYVYWLFPFRFS